MLNDIIQKKLEQMSTLLGELRELLAVPFSEFKSAFRNVRSAERNYQLVVELASDINAQIIADSGAQTPDTYKESFKRIAIIGVLDEKSLPSYIKSANLRNILIHEYDFDEDNFIFYKSAKDFIILYEQYIRLIHKYIEAKKGVATQH
ncbi:MAG: DUF86 domain-containing protein [Candidatus Taylorbacteria bacterium]|nr:DUF86 domain-containing protein [Candidatus Taylorbacteria bacterium]